MSADTTSTTEMAISVLGDLLNAALTDARHLDIASRQVVEAWAELDQEARIALADIHPQLVEALLRLEHLIQRIDER